MKNILNSAKAFAEKTMGANNAQSLTPKNILSSVSSAASNQAKTNIFANTEEAKHAFENTLFRPELAPEDPYKETEKYGDEIMKDIKKKLYVNTESGIHINIINSVRSYFYNISDIKHRSIPQKTGFIAVVINKFIGIISEIMNGKYDIDHKMLVANTVFRIAHSHTTTSTEIDMIISKINHRMGGYVPSTGGVPDAHTEQNTTVGGSHTDNMPPEYPAHYLSLFKREVLSTDVKTELTDMVRDAFSAYLDTDPVQQQFEDSLHPLIQENLVKTTIQMLNNSADRKHILCLVYSLVLDSTIIKLLNDEGIYTFEHILTNSYANKQAEIESRLRKNMTGGSLLNSALNASAKFAKAASEKVGKNLDKFADAATEKINSKLDKATEAATKRFSDSIDKAEEYATKNMGDASEHVDKIEQHEPDSTENPMHKTDTIPTDYTVKPNTNAATQSPGSHPENEQELTSEITSMFSKYDAYTIANNIINDFLKYVDELLVQDAVGEKIIQITIECIQSMINVSPDDVDNYVEEYDKIRNALDSTCGHVIAMFHENVNIQLAFFYIYMQTPDNAFLNITREIPQIPTISQNISLDSESMRIMFGKASINDLISNYEQLYRIDMDTHIIKDIIEASYEPPIEPLDDIPLTDIRPPIYKILLELVNFSEPKFSKRVISRQLFDVIKQAFKLHLDKQDAIEVAFRPLVPPQIELYTKIYNSFHISEYEVFGFYINNIGDDILRFYALALHNIELYKSVLHPTHADIGVDTVHQAAIFIMKQLLEYNCLDDIYKSGGTKFFKTTIADVIEKLVKEMSSPEQHTGMVEMSPDDIIKRVVDRINSAGLSEETVRLVRLATVIDKPGDVATPTLQKPHPIQNTESIGGRRRRTIRKRNRSKRK